MRGAMGSGRALRARCLLHSYSCFFSKWSDAEFMQ
jgi:hypothetical protein